MADDATKVGVNPITIPNVNVAVKAGATDDVTSTAVSEPPIPPSPPPTVQPTGRPKEFEPSYTKIAEVGGVEEVLTQAEIEKMPELAGFMEPVKKEETPVTPVTDDYTQEILLKGADNAPGVVTLPLTQQQVEEDLHKGIWESVRWLAEWCVRQIKMLPGRVMYRKQ